MSSFSRFSIGDEVRITSLTETDRYYGISQSMRDMYQRGETFRIRDIGKRGKRIKSDNWKWHPDDLEAVNKLNCTVTKRPA